MRIKPYTAGRNQIEVMIVILLKTHHLQWRDSLHSPRIACCKSMNYSVEKLCRIYFNPYHFKINMKNSLPRLNPNSSEIIVLNKRSSNFPEIIFYEWRTRGGLCTCHRFAPRVDPRDRTSRGICRGIQGDRLDSLPLGEEKIHDIVLCLKGRWWGIANFVKWRTVPTGIYIMEMNRKKGFIKWEALRLLRTNSFRENFEQSKRGCQQTLVQEILTEVMFTDRNEALHNRIKQDILQYLQSGHTESQKDSHETLQETSFNSKLSLKISLTSHRLSPTGKKNLSRAF